MTRTFLELVQAGDGVDVLLDLLAMPPATAIAIAADIGYELGRESEQHDIAEEWLRMMDESAVGGVPREVPREEGGGHATA